MIILIDNYDSFTYNLYQFIRVLHDDVRVYRNDAIDLKTLSQLKPQGIILSPGPGRPEDAGICLELVRYLADTPDFKTILLGVCLGHQAIVQALGGKIVHANKIVHGKSDAIYHNGRGIYENMPFPFAAGRYHSLVASPEHLPSSISIEARNSEGNIMGVRHKHLSLYGVQFHPESILTPEGHSLLKTFVRLSEGVYG